MPKLVKAKKKKKKLNLVRFTIAFFSFSLIVSLVSSLFLRSYNDSLSMKVQEIQNQISSVQTENDSLTVTIQTLSSRDRVVSIADESGLSSNQDNIVTINPGN